ncbi:MAG: sigma-70 family RNA polymerase sigma factor [Magnetococcales bacterium]|nr:sigma-70 family RNA polymerase sigma factor [Magnetococcales bacterium]NGZ25515.1 sigma-70 family RNA polymerase sigma factor [Magnetococcales bacterium]
MTIAPDADFVMVEKAKQGDQKAFEILVRKYQGKVASVISRTVSDDPAKVQDLVQEVFIKAYRALNNFRNESAFFTWLYRIAVNTAKNHVMTTNKMHNPLELDAEEGGELVAPELRDNDTPESRLLRSELLDSLRQAIDALTPQMREVIIMRELQGKSYEEIASAVNCPIGTVRSRIFRGRQEVAEKLRNYLNGGKDKSN